VKYTLLNAAGSSSGNQCSGIQTMHEISPEYCKTTDICCWQFHQW